MSNPDNLKLSIVIPTLGREKELRNLLESIKSNIRNVNYEVIIVDQNFSSLLDDIVKYFSEFYTIKHRKVNFRGLSRAKNYGLEESSGETIIFMDDDAEILPGSIDLALNFLDYNPKIDAICGRMVDRDYNDSVKKFCKEKGLLSINNFEDKFIESSMMFRTLSLDNYRFDEKLGCGTFHGAEEGYDLIYRLLLQGNKIWFDPHIIYYHPQTISTKTSDAEIRRVFSYRCGYAALCKKHSFKRKYYSRLIKIFLYIPFLFLFKRKYFRYYTAELLGLLSGKVID